MAWIILIRALAEHFEYWSAEKEKDEFTGLIHYGRVGSSGRDYDYGDGYEAEAKMEEKLGKGYEIFQRKSKVAVPTIKGVKLFLEAEGKVCKWKECSYVE